MARILIIDDDAAVRRIMRRVVERMGHEVEEAADGAMGLSLFRQGTFDLVVTDLFMPEKEGIETIMEIREDSPGVKILAVSGGMRLDRIGPLEDAEVLGADASLPKPFAIQDLTAAVQALLSA